jgi:hypothetical protein
MSSSDKSYCVLDFVFYRGVNNTQVVKELAVVGMADQRRQHWVFEPPYAERMLTFEVRSENLKRKERVRYGWADGDVPYSKLPSIVKRVTGPYSNVFVDGDSNSQMVADMINRPVLNFKQLAGWFRMGVNLGALHTRYNYTYASPCIAHRTSDEKYCAKSRSTLLANIIRNHFDALKEGKANLYTVRPVGFHENNNNNDTIDPDYGYSQVYSDGGGGGDAVDVIDSADPAANGIPVASLRATRTVADSASALVIESDH